MTDKEIKTNILAEIERLLTELTSAGEENVSIFEEGRISAFEDMKLFINSLPEEPEFTIDKDVSQMAGEFAEREYELDGYERKWLSKGYYHGYMDANKSKPEEPVSEDLIQASEEYVSPWQVYAEDADGELLLTNEPCERAFIAGAQWQKKKTINKVVEWLKENVHKYADSFVDSFELCKDLKQILEED